METYLVYIGKAAIGAGAFYLAYLLMFQHQKHFGFNRIYLPVSLALSFMIPLITFTTTKYIEPVNFDGNSFAYLAPVSGEIQQPVFVLEWYHYLFGLYLLGAGGFLFHLLLGHLKAIKIVKQSTVQQKFGTKVNVTKKNVHPFSFFSKIVIAEKTLSHPELEMIVSHEKIHVREKHTLDILFTEIMFLLQWFNPFAWLLKDAVKNNLEYKTDHEIVKQFNPQEYQLAMVSLAGEKGVAPFLTALNGSQLKNRIIMMKKKTENKFGVIKQLAVLPLLAILVMGLSNKEMKTEIISQQSSANKFKDLVVIVDGQIIPTNTGKLRSLDLSKSYDSGEIIETLGIDENRVESTVMSIDDNSEKVRLFIRTTDYVEGYNREFDEMTKNQVPEYQTTKTSKTLYAIDGELKTKEEIGNLENYSIESMSVLTGKNATDKYGDEVADASVIDLKTGESRVKISTSEEKTIQGKVSDEKGKPLAGVAVLVKGTTTGTITDAKGDFKLLINDKAETLIFSLDGFESAEVAAGQEKTQRIELELKADKKAKPSEIVVVGYGAQKAESSSPGGYSISGGMNGTMQKGSENFTITPSTQNGLTIKSGGDPAKQPLYIVDGTEVKIVENLNPEEIERIEVLKDQSATAVYGDKGKNGVILISTKKNDNPVQVKTTGKTKSGEPLFYIVDEMPEYQGGDAALRSKIANDIKYPVIAQENGIQGKVYVSFVISKDGKVTEPVIAKGVDPALDKEALRVVHNLEKWTPGKNDGEPVNVSYTVPINFVLQGRSVGQSFSGSGQLDQQAINDLRRKIAQTIKYPVVAQENNQQGVVDIWAIVEKDGTISNISEKRLEGKIINVDEVVVTSYKSEKTVTSEKSKDLDLLIKESKRVIEQLSPLAISALAGETVSFRIKFVLE